MRLVIVFTPSDAPASVYDAGWKAGAPRDATYPGRTLGRWGSTEAALAGWLVLWLVDAFKVERWRAHFLHSRRDACVPRRWRAGFYTAGETPALPVRLRSQLRLILRNPQYLTQAGGAVEH